MDACSVSCTNISNIHINLSDTMNIKTEINTCFIAEAAVNKRKFLIKRRLKDYSFTEDSDDEEDL